MARTGRPLKYDDPDIFDEKVNNYFVEENQPWTILGLCIYLDICRDTLCEFEHNRTDLSDTIKKAKTKIESFAENRLFTSGNPAGIIFNLKNNFNWKDKQEIVSENTNVNVDMTPEYFAEYLKKD